MKKYNKMLDADAENKAVIYARFSPGPRQTEQSIEGQVRDCTAYAESKGLNILNIYADRKISGTDFENRDAFNQMIADCAKGKFKYIIVWKIDRFGRDREEIALNKSRVKKHGVKLLYAKECIPDGPEGIILEAMLEGLAEYYIADLRQKVIRGQRESALKGLAVGGGRAYGYDLVERRYVINEAEANIVRQTFLLYSTGHTALEIIAEFNKKGLRRRDGQEFTTSHIYHMLRNEKYIGICKFQDIPIPIPSIVDKELWNACHARFKKRTDKTVSGAYKAKENYLFSLKCYCGECGASMVGESGYGKQKVRYSYYKCLNRKKKARTCDMRIFRKNDFEQCIIENTMNVVLQENVIQFLADQVIAIQAKNTVNVTLANLKNALRETEKTRNNIMKAIEQGIITETTKERMFQLEEQIAELKLSIAREEIKKPTLTREQVLFWLYSFRDGDVADTDFQERLCDTFIHSIYCYKDKVVIAYNHSGKNNNHSVPITALVGSDMNYRMRHRGFEPRTT